MHNWRLCVCLSRHCISKNIQQNFLHSETGYLHTIQLPGIFLTSYFMAFEAFQGLAMSRGEAVLMNTAPAIFRMNLSGGYNLIHSVMLRVQNDHTPISSFQLRDLYIRHVLGQLHSAQRRQP